MARNIDFSNLDADDIQYLRQRSWLVDEAELQGFDGVRSQVEHEEVEESEEETEDDQESGEADEISYSEASVEELKAELKDRGLAVGGSKAELVARLEANDAESEDEEEEEA